MSWWGAYRLRLARKRWRLRAFRKRRELRPVADRTAAIRPGDILLLTCLRNEAPRLDWFLQHYRGMGVAHVLAVDNGSTDGGAERLAGEPDVSLWRTDASYARARHGVDWLNWLAMRHGTGHWCLTVDPDELLVYPYCDTRPLAALTDWLDGAGTRSFAAMLLDLYPKGPLGEREAAPGQDPLEVASWFDPANYTIRRNPRLGNLWIQGGPRARAFFADRPRDAPALNKIPLVRWDRRTAYVSSTHALLPRGLNATYDREGGERASGILLHTKLAQGFGAKAEEEVARGEHYRASVQYRAYREGARADLWTPWSERYINWRQLEVLGLMSKGSWA